MGTNRRASALVYIDLGASAKRDDRGIKLNVRTNAVFVDTPVEVFFIFRFESERIAKRKVYAEVVRVEAAWPVDASAWIGL